MRGVDAWVAARAGSSVADASIGACAALSGVAGVVASVPTSRLPVTARSYAMSRYGMRVGDLSITALYTSAVWAWGRVPCAHLLATTDAKRVFDVTNAALAVTGA